MTSHHLALALLAATLSVLPIAQASPWAKVRVTAPGPAAAIGEAANGCLIGAAALPEQGKGYVHIRRERHRHFGHPWTIAFIQDLGAEMARRGGGAMMVGDLSQPRGGLMSSSHRSHQNGLDLDIWFLLIDSPAQAKRAYPEQRDPPSMITADGLTVNPAWGPDQRFLLHRAATDPRVDRIFVNPAIKQTLCETEGGDRHWLRKLRPWRRHDAHFHVRLKCPQDSPDCQAQPPLATGDGCGPELAWWFTDEARRPKKGGVKPAAPMPAACRALLSNQELARKE